MVKEKNEIGIKSIYNLNEISKPKALILGFQHMFAMFGATVLVPILTGLSVQTTLLMAGLGTLLFHLITGGKVPAFLGSSFAFIAGYHAIAGAPGSEGFNAENLPYACGGVFVAGLVYVVVAGLIKLIGIKRVMRFFPPVVTGPIIICIGLILAPVAISSITREITRADGTAVPSGVNWVIALAAILTIIICNIWARGMLKIIPILLGIIVGYVVALLFGVVNFSGLSGLSVVGLPIAKENLMKFNASAIITMVPISLATMMEHVGDISAISATVGKNYIASPGLHRSLIGDGLATSFASIFGGP
ncbi:MAG TPA: solute carrier family 23 protein, partial [Bacillota bacterium]|nr:solute carrier family 23 protein [Bacillota bacterium]